MFSPMFPMLRSASRNPVPVPFSAVKPPGCVTWSHGRKALITPTAFPQNRPRFLLLSWSRDL